MSKQHAQEKIEMGRRIAELELELELLSQRRCVMSRELLQQAHEIGFLRAAEWAGRADMFADTTSPAYFRERDFDEKALEQFLMARQAQPVQPAPIPSNPGELEKEAFWRDTITKTHFEMGFPESCQPPPPDAIDALIKAEAALEFALDVVRCYEEGGGASETGEFIVADLAVVRAAIAAQQDRAERPVVPEGLIDCLRGGRQCDEDGTEIIMSRQACCEAADLLEALGSRPPTDQQDSDKATAAQQDDQDADDKFLVDAHQKFENWWNGLEAELREKLDKKTLAFSAWMHVSRDFRNIAAPTNGEGGI